MSSQVDKLHRRVQCLSVSLSLHSCSTVYQANAAISNFSNLPHRTFLHTRSQTATCRHIMDTCCRMPRVYVALHSIIYRVGQIVGHRLMTIILPNLNRFKFFFTGRFLGKFVVKWILKVPPHFAHVATLPCETLLSAKQAINDNLRGSVATYLRCGGVVNNQIKTGLLPGQHTAERRRKCTRQSRSCL